MHSALSVPRPVSDGQLYKMLIAVLIVTCVYLSLWSATDSVAVAVFDSDATSCCQLSWWQVGQILGKQLLYSLKLDGLTVDTDSARSLSGNIIL